MKVSGFWLVGAGLATMVAGSVFKTSIEGYSGDTLNIGLLQQQLMTWMVGVGLLIAGIIVIALGEAVDQLTTIPDRAPRKINARSAGDPALGADFGTELLDPDLPASAHDPRLRPGSHGAQV